MPVLSFFILLLTPTLTLAQVAYTPLVGLPGVDTGGDFNKFINTLYILSISIAALLAVIKITIAGVKYMLTDVVTSKSEAKKDIQGALLGLLVVISAVMILTFINPQLTTINFNPDRVEVAYVPSPPSSKPDNLGPGDEIITGITETDCILQGGEWYAPGGYCIKRGREGTDPTDPVDPEDPTSHIDGEYSLTFTPTKKTYPYYTDFGYFDQPGSPNYLGDHIISYVKYTDWKDPEAQVGSEINVSIRRNFAEEDINQDYFESVTIGGTTFYTRDASAFGVSDGFNTAEWSWFNEDSPFGGNSNQTIVFN
jgi:hypothetical protein